MASLGVTVKLIGGAGDDFLGVSEGTADGGTGNDFFSMVALGFAPDISATVTGGAGEDVLDTQSLLTDYIISVSSGVVRFEAKDTGSRAFVSGVEALNGEEMAIRMSDIIGANIVNDGSLARNVNGEAGMDIVTGGGGSDALKGNGGDDILSGDARQRCPPGRRRQ